MRKIDFFITTTIIGTLLSFNCLAIEIGYQIYIEHLGDPDVLVLDDTWILTGSGNHVHNGSVYEYWMIFKSSQSLPEYHPDCHFFITQSDSINIHRNIIKKSRQFFHQYIDSNEVAISLDYENDLSMRFKLGT